MTRNKPIKVCFFAKYPPIEGGVSSQTYWMSRALGERGVEVHIITNALEVEEEFRQKINFSDPADKKEYRPKNVFIHSLGSGPNFHIPFSPAYLERLLNLGMRVIKEYDCDLIDSYYIQPYGLAAVFAKLLTGKPCILRHAGSDLFRLFPSEAFQTLYGTAFEIADIIVTSLGQKDLFKSCGVTEDKLWFRPPSSVNPKYFNPKVRPADLAKFGVPRKLLKKPILTYAGKFGSAKSLSDLVKAASKIKDDFLLLFIINGLGLEEFKAYLNKFPSLKNRYYFLEFLPPWRIPSIFKASNCLLQLESGFPINIHRSSQPLEAFALSTPVLISNEIFSKYKTTFPRLERDRNVLAVNPQNQKNLENVLLKIIRNPKKTKEVGKYGYQELFGINSRLFEEMVEKQISLYQKVLRGSKK